MKFAFSHVRLGAAPGMKTNKFRSGIGCEIINFDYLAGKGTHEKAA